jgi:hypothetical protein
LDVGCFPLEQIAGCLNTPVFAVCFCAAHLKSLYNFPADASLDTGRKRTSGVLLSF